jgi:ribosomal protein S12
MGVLNEEDLFEGLYNETEETESAQRKIAKVLLATTKKYVTVYIPGQGHNCNSFLLFLSWWKG